MVHGEKALMNVLEHDQHLNRERYCDKYNYTQHLECEPIF